MQATFLAADTIAKVHADDGAALVYSESMHALFLLEKTDIVDYPITKQGAAFAAVRIAFSFSSLILLDKSIIITPLPACPIRARLFYALFSVFA